MLPRRGANGGRKGPVSGYLLTVPSCDGGDRLNKSVFHITRGELGVSPPRRHLSSQRATRVVGDSVTHVHQCHGITADW